MLPYVWKNYFSLSRLHDSLFLLDVQKTNEGMPQDIQQIKQKSLHNVWQKRVLLCTEQLDVHIVKTRKKDLEMLKIWSLLLIVMKVASSVRQQELKDFLHGSHQTDKSIQEISHWNHWQLSEHVNCSLAIKHTKTSHQEKFFLYFVCFLPTIKP